jgi:hypothetical protein
MIRLGTSKALYIAGFIIVALLQLYLLVDSSIEVINISVGLSLIAAAYGFYVIYKIVNKQEVFVGYVSLKPKERRFDIYLGILLSLALIIFPTFALLN